MSAGEMDPPREPEVTVGRTKPPPEPDLELDLNGEGE
jgi:hypothetical protein